MFACHHPSAGNSTFTLRRTHQPPSREGLPGNPGSPALGTPQRLTPFPANHSSLANAPFRAGGRQSLPSLPTSHQHKRSPVPLSPCNALRNNHAGTKATYRARADEPQIHNVGELALPSAHDRLLLSQSPRFGRTTNW